jgi:large subunit ribosomal protein L10
MTSHTRKWKEAQVKELQELASKYSVIATASLQNFPGPLAKELRKKLKGKAVIKVSKTRIVKKALLEARPEAKALDSSLKGNIAVIFTEMNPFELFALLKKNSVSMPAKTGIIAPDDITIPAGDTGLPPGPALSDLKAAGLKTVMQGPTISIAEDKVVAKKGEVITEGVAGALSKLGIKPVKVRLSMTSALENGQVFLASVLDIDIDKVRQNFASCARTAFNIAVEIAYFTKETVPALVAKGYRNAKAVALEANIINSATVSEILGKADSQARAVKAMVKDTVPEAPEGNAGSEAKAEAGSEAKSETSGEAKAEEEQATGEKSN